MIKVDIIKRIKAIEKQIFNDEIPVYIMIYYDWNTNDWVVNEKFRPFAPGKPNESTKHFKHYKDYVFHPKYEGMVVLDLIDCPENLQIDLIGCDFYELRKGGLKNCAISIEPRYDIPPEKFSFPFTVSVHE